jgi:hypothetical protein
MITNIDGMPFDEELASHMAKVLSRETGRYYRPAPFLYGYGIEQDTQVQSSFNVSNSEPPIYLRPAIQSQLWNVLFILVALWIYVYLESLMMLIGIDALHATLYNLIGKTFPWVTTVFFLEKLVLLIALLLCWSVFYNLASRSYMIGPKGVETTIGLFNKDESRVEFKHVRGMKLRRAWYQRLLFYGTIEIATSGTDGSEIRFRHIARPRKYMAIVKERAKNVF